MSKLSRKHTKLAKVIRNDIKAEDLSYFDEICAEYSYLDQLCAEIVEMTKKTLKANDKLDKFNENWPEFIIINEKELKLMIIEAIECL